MGPTQTEMPLSFHDGPPDRLERPLMIVHGNCQAESLRRMFDPCAELVTVRIPPVHELVREDLGALRAWLDRAAVLVSQPVRRGYRGLPLGTAEVIVAAGAGTRVVLVPVIRFAGLYPEQAIIRPPDDPGAVPPLVPYHSLRTLARAAGRELGPLRPGAVREIAERSRAELASRERAHGTLVVSDLFDRPHFDLMRTINHPGNPVWTALADRVAAVLAPELSPTPRDPGRPLLDAIHAPREPAVIAAYGLEDDPDPDWRVDGERIDAGTVQAAHLRWYAAHPAAVRAGVERHRDALRAIGPR